MSTRGVELTPEDLVFSNATGEPIHPDTVTHEWLKLMKRLGIRNFRLQNLRHTHASILLPLTTSKAVSEKLGHASVQITLDTYSHILPGMEEEVLKAFDAVLGTTPSTDNSY
jgi:integrase